jgi:hypothetical protein
MGSRTAVVGSRFSRPETGSTGSKERGMPTEEFDNIPDDIVQDTAFLDDYRMCRGFTRTFVEGM